MGKFSFVAADWKSLGRCCWSEWVAKEIAVHMGHFSWKSEMFAVCRTTMYLAGWIGKVCLFDVDCGAVSWMLFVLRCCFRNTIFCLDQMDICHVSIFCF